MIFAAIDPGAVNAAIAVFHDGSPQFVADIRTVNGMLDAVALAHALEDMKVSCAVIENVHSMPAQGVASTFKFGMGVGIIHGVCGALRLPVTLVTPTQWKAFHNLPADKERARELAIRNWPSLNKYLDRRKDINRAEALLIGDWYYVRCVIPRQTEEHLF